MPTISEIYFNNIFWQETLTCVGTFCLYAAYRDVRKENKRDILNNELRVTSYELDFETTSYELW